MIDLKTTLERTRSLTVPMNQLKIASRREIQYKDKLLRMSDTAFKDMLKLVGLTVKTVDHLNDNLRGNAGFAIMKQLMKAVSENKGNVALMLSEDDMEIKRICSEDDLAGAENSVSAGVISDMIHYALDESPKVKLTNTFVSDGGTKIAFNLKWDNPIALKFRDEDISFGKQIVWDLLGPTTMQDLVEREICTNGMTAIMPDRKATFISGATTPSEWYNLFFKDLVNPPLEKIAHYQERVGQAMATNLSVHEYNQIKAHLETNWSADMPRITRYLGSETWKADYLNRGIKLQELTAGQLRNCPTPVNSWDAVNCLTDMASHKYTTPVSDRVAKETQRLAGTYLNKTWDANQQIFNAPSYTVAAPQKLFSLN